MTVARVALPVALDRSFDYWAPEGLALTRGNIVRVELARRSIIGVVIAIVSESAVPRDELQPIVEVVPLPPLADDVLALCEFVARYYQQPLGMALALAVPPLGIRRALRVNAETAERYAATLEPTLNADQQAAVVAIRAAAGTFAAFLLQGVTGSGKTDVFLAAADTAIAQGGQVLLLVPEINLTPQLESRVRHALPRANAFTLHSGLSDGERRAHWNAASNGDAQFVLGTRLAVFCALPRLALIVVDEEHDTSYKQQDGVRYQARDVAVWRARSRNVPIVLSSATPSLESFAQTRAGRYLRLSLPRRADPRAQLPQVSLVPNRGEASRDGISGPLWNALAACLGRGEQALVFVNRRGYAPSLKCSACGWQADCLRCSARLTMHRDPPSMQCHHCGHLEALPPSCPQCGNVDLLPQGYGTQRLERALTQAFPHARTLRVDRDSTRPKGSFAAMRTQVAEQSIDLLIGTQMLAKGHDFPRLTLVGVLGADNALYSADFRATERLAALLTQVAGRAGRAGLPGAVIVQTDFPEHPVFAALATHDYDRFAHDLLLEREAAQLPPATHVVLLLAEAHQRGDVDAFLRHAHAAACRLAVKSVGAVTVYSPVPAVLARRAGFERGQLVVQSPNRAELQRFASQWREALVDAPGTRVRVSLDVDPASFC
ncbi:MAG TPA: primosomal protein N' [Casimicrobiaceae bacterium]|jgi:primosomal protein N' (replication factor Y)